MSTLAGPALANHDDNSGWYKFSHRNGHVYTSDEQCLWLNIYIAVSDPGFVHDKPFLETYGSIDYRVKTWDPYTGHQTFRCANTRYEAPPGGLQVRQGLAKFDQASNTTFWCNIGAWQGKPHHWTHDVYTSWGPFKPCGAGWYYMRGEVRSNVHTFQHHGMNTYWVHVP